MMRATQKIITFLVCLLFLTSIFTLVSAEEPVYTIEDNNSNITIKSGEKIIISLVHGLPYIWELYSYEPSVLKLIDEGGWVHGDNPGSQATHNWTFEGNNEGNTTLSFIYWDTWDIESIHDVFTLHINTVGDSSISTFWKMIIVVSIIIVVPTIVIKKWIIGGEGK